VRSLVHARAAHFTRRDVCVDPGELYAGSAHRCFLLNHGLANRAAPEVAGAARSTIPQARAIRFLTRRTWRLRVLT
jgi:hypothetical protein